MVFSMGVIKRWVKFLVAQSWLWRLLTRKRWQDKVIILMYHKVLAESPNARELTVAHFRAHLDWLEKNFEVLTPEQFVALDRSLPLQGKPKVLLTFDDAFISIKEQAYPLLKERNLRGLVFVPSEPVIERDTIWPQKTSDLFLYGDYDQLPSFDEQQRMLAPCSQAERIVAEQKVRQKLKKMPDVDRRQAVAALESAAHWDASQLPHDSKILSWDELRACGDVFTYGGHTHTHPIMSSQTRQEQASDVNTCADHLRRELQLEPLLFAYPNGELGDYNQDSIEVLKEAGYQWAFTTQEGVYRLQDDPMTIRRLPTWAPATGDLAWLILTAV